VNAPNAGGAPSVSEKLIAEIQKTDPNLARRTRIFLTAIENPKVLKRWMVQLWKQAGANQRTPAAELEHILGGEATEEFGEAIADPRTLVDEPFWSQVWDALFDAEDFEHGLHRPEALGQILQEPPEAAEPTEPRPGPGAERPHRPPGHARALGLPAAPSRAALAESTPVLDQ
jgi:hypothetical protein